jgi:putative glutamine amidotransferase
MATYKPRIGITMRLETATERFYLGRDYSEALAWNGAIPLHLSLIPDKAYIAGALDNLDGILLPGSDSDVDPLHYGQEPHPELGPVQPLKDATDALVIAEAERRNLPLLAICYGMQALNVARGGTLIQDLRSGKAQVIQHEQGVPRDRLSHRLKVAEDSLLAELTQVANPLVNSHHHQAVDRIGNNLRATAWTADGIVEGLEDTRSERFNLGVQWHPEIAWERDEFAKAIFRAFISYSKLANK